MKICPECDGLSISIKERGEIVCRKCGLIITERDFDIFYSNVKTFNEKEKNQRWRPEISISYLLSEIGLNTLINSKRIYNKDLKRAVRRDSYMSWKKKEFNHSYKRIKKIRLKTEYS